MGLSPAAAAQAGGLSFVGFLGYLDLNMQIGYSLGFGMVCSILCMSPEEFSWELLPGRIPPRLLGEGFTCPVS